jgi:hypothetical protein
MLQPNGSNQRFLAGEKEYDLHGNEIVYECANIYGTKFGGRLFCDGLAEWLTTEMGFRRSEVDPSLYLRKADETHSILVLGNVDRRFGIHSRYRAHYKVVQPKAK